MVPDPFGAFAACGLIAAPAAVFLLFGSDTFAAVLIGVGAGWYCRNSPEATASSRTRPYVGRAAMTPNAGKRQACRRLLLVAYATANLVEPYTATVALVALGQPWAERWGCWTFSS
jgi:hypothetical protein